jgi:DNA-directed RNA polymerase specialized sigma24 family protein
MAKDAAMDERLWRWAEWLKSGDGSGYPVKCTLHEDWSPPSPGMTPSMKVAPHNDARQTQSLVHLLSDRLLATLVAHYVVRLSAADAAAVLDCKPDTVHARIEAAHGELLGLLKTQRMELCNIREVV